MYEIERPQMCIYTITPTKAPSIQLKFTGLCTFDAHVLFVYIHICVCVSELHVIHNIFHISSVLFELLMLHNVANEHEGIYKCYNVNVNKKNWPDSRIGYGSGG